MDIFKNCPLRSFIELPVRFQGLDENAEKLFDFALNDGFRNAPENDDGSRLNGGIVLS